MTRQPAYDVGRQIDALTTLRKRSGKGRSQVAVELGMEADTYRRYENGQTELRVSQVEAFAQSYGVSPATLLRAIGFEPDTQTFDAEALLTEAGMPANEIRATLATIADWDIDAQRACILDKVRTLMRAEPRKTPRVRHAG